MHTATGFRLFPAIGFLSFDIRPLTITDERRVCYAHYVVEDIDIYRSANVLVRQHGEDAPIEAAMRADAMLEAGDMEGFAVWRRIVRAVGELLEKKPSLGLLFADTVEHFPGDCLGLLLCSAPGGGSPPACADGT